jgi:glycosyltransferase involved in cell wall biosynthesis
VSEHLAPAAGNRVALVHDFLVDVRGAERVFLELCAMWPDAPIYTAIYDEEGTEGRFAGRTVRTSFLQRLRPSARTFRTLFPLYPYAIGSLDLSEHDLVISSTSAWAHGVRSAEHARHVSYCYNPFRYAWNDSERTVARCPDPISRALLREVLRRWRHWDLAAARRTDRYIASSRLTQRRIRDYYRRESEVVYPAVDTSRFSPGPVKDYYVLVSELMDHKCIHIAIDAFNRLHQKLVIVGDGPESRKLRRQAGPTIHFTGRITDTEVADVIQGARAMVSTAVEEFGIAMVESQAAGRPVIARREGGALETVIDGVTGCFWSGGPEALAEAVLNFDDSAVNPEDCVRSAARFNVDSFRRGIRQQVDAAHGTPGQRLERPPIDRYPRDRAAGRSL